MTTIIIKTMNNILFKLKKARQADDLQAVLDYGGPDWHLELIKKEIEWRQSEQVN